MRRFQGSILAFIFCLGFQTGFGSPEADSLLFHHIKTAMSQSSATQIFEDSYGFLWIGTPNGINRYDGTSFQVYEKSSGGGAGLTDGYIESIYEDSDRQLYIGTNRGLNIYDRSLNIIKRYPFKLEGQVLQSQYIGSIAKTRDFLWLGTERNGVYRYNVNSGETKSLIFEQVYQDGPSNNYIVGIFPISKDRLVVSTQVLVYIINEDLEILGVTPNLLDISCAIKCSDSNFWIGSHNGRLIKLDIAADNEISIETVSVNADYSILSLAADDEGNIWTGSENNGLSIYSTKTKDIIQLKADVKKPNSINGNSIWSLYKAKNGVMWVGPFKQGLSFYDPLYHKFKHIRKDPFNSGTLSNNIINCFSEDKNGNLWIGTDGGGLDYWDRQSNSFKNYSLEKGNLNANVILCLFQDANNRLWLGTWDKGLIFFDPTTGDYTNWNRDNSFLGSNHVIDIIKDRKDRMWIVTLFGGVHLYYPSTDTYRHFHLESIIDGSEVITMARLLEDDAGNIWVGTQTAGLFRISENKGSWSTVHYQSLDTTRGLSNDFINTTIQDDQKTIWVGTQAGLNKYNTLSDTFTFITKSDGLKDDAIKGIIKDNEGFLWLSTGKGIIRYDPDSGESFNYDPDDGLQGNQFNASSFYKTKRGEFLFGGSNGFNVFTLDNVIKRKNELEIYVSGLKLFNKPLLAGDDTGILEKDISQVDTVIFNYDHSVIRFDYRAITYRHPHKVKYAYFLDGFESDWNYVGNNSSATYTNLKPGEYTLRIKSTNSDGVWSTKEKALIIIVKPPFWSTWWFRTSTAILILTIIYSVYLIRIRNFEKRQIELEEQINDRTRELQYKQKKLRETADELSTRNEEIQRFTFAVSHDLKSPLNTIKGITGLIAMEGEYEDTSDIKKYLELIETSCDTMGNLITDITEIARIGKIENNIQNLNTYEIIQSAKTLVFGRLKDRNVELKVPNHLPSIAGDKNRMIQVFENLMDNAVKYMGNQKTPVIEIGVNENKDTNQFFVRDNGSGMDENALKYLFTPFMRFDDSVEGTGLGLYMISQIIQSHEGFITASSGGLGKGSTFIMSLPKKLDTHKEKSSKQPES
ncbi:MAG: two-component regulator propeller domain-containing protein [Bacteroidota bacterium]